MATIVFAQQFHEKREEVRSPRRIALIDEKLRLIASFPGVGSSLLPSYMRRSYGPEALRVVAGAYSIIYEYDRLRDTVYVYDLLSSSELA